MAKEYGLGGRVCFTGSVHENDLADVYRSAHIFSLVSESGHGRGEGIPLTPLEAAACGVPILVSNQDGSQEAVSDNSNGFVLDPSKPDELERTLLELTRNIALRDRMGRAARVKAEKDFGFASFVEKHRTLLALWFPARFASEAASCSPFRYQT
jgi:phosphatidylinositol alpha-1,6-mannosyltransferase